MALRSCRKLFPYHINKKPTDVSITKHYFAGLTEKAIYHIISKNQKVGGLMTKNTNPLIIDGQFKDQSPEATVQRIQQILASYGIQVEEEWRETSVPYCFAMSARVEGTTFMANGKGLTREFARASGYAELMERLQLGFICSPQGLKENEAQIAPDSRRNIPAQELLQENRKWFDLLSRRIDEFHAPAATAEEIVANLTTPEGTVPVVPFYNLCTRKPAYYPDALFQRLYGSNGCAAGNTPEEAIVQAISETVERCHTIRVINEDLALPDVPESELEKYPISMSIIRFIRESGYRVQIKDCSLGKKFPVICACIIDPRTGRYYTHMGAYPIFEIAIERALTESFQGRSIDRIATYENLRCQHENGFKFASINTEFTIGAWEKSPGFFVSQPKYPYNPDAGFTGKNNRELLHECLNYFKDQGLDVLIRNSSCFGFFTCQVLIPGFSDIYLNRVCAKNSDMRYCKYAMAVLRDPVRANTQQMLGYLMHLEQRNRNSPLLRKKYTFSNEARLPLAITAAENEFLSAAVHGYVCWSLGQHQQIPNCVQTMLRCCTTESEEALLGLKRMLSMKSHKQDRIMIQNTLRFFHTEETTAWLLNCLDGKENPFEHFVLRCSPDMCDSCRFKDRCCQKRVNEISSLIRNKTNELSFDEFAQTLDQILS